MAASKETIPGVDGQIKQSVLGKMVRGGGGGKIYFELGGYPSQILRYGTCIIQMEETACMFSAGLFSTDVEGRGIGRVDVENNISDFWECWQLCEVFSGLEALKKETCIKLG